MAVSVETIENYHYDSMTIKLHLPNEKSFVISIDNSYCEIDK